MTIFGWVCNYFLLLRQQVRKYDLVIVGFPPVEVGFITILWCKLRKIPSVLDIKKTGGQTYFGPEKKGLLSALLKAIFYPWILAKNYAFRSADQVTTISYDFLKWVYESGREPSENDQIGYLVPPRQKVSEPDQARISRTGITRLKFVFIGSLSEIYDFSIVNEIIGWSQKSGITCEFVIAGSGEPLVGLQAQFRSFPNVSFPGWVDQKQIDQIYKEADFCIAPYRNLEDFNASLPNKVIESICNGVPVISTLGDDFQSLVRDYEVGFSLNHDASVSTFLNKIIIDPEAHERMRQNCRNVAALLFDFEIMAAKMSRQLR